MANKNTISESSYLPVAWEYKEVIEEEIKKGNKGKIFFFNATNQVDEVEGTAVKLAEEQNKGMFVFLDTGRKIRIDRIITLFGKIGAAYQEYDAYANACMDCTGGVE